MAWSKYSLFWFLNFDVENGYISVWLGVSTPCSAFLGLYAGNDYIMIRLSVLRAIGLLCLLTDCGACRSRGC